MKSADLYFVEYLDGYAIGITGMIPGMDAEMNIWGHGCSAPLEQDSGRTLYFPM